MNKLLNLSDREGKLSVRVVVLFSLSFRFLLLHICWQRAKGHFVMTVHKVPFAGDTALCHGFIIFLTLFLLKRKVFGTLGRTHST